LPARNKKRNLSAKTVFTFVWKRIFAHQYKSLKSRFYLSRDFIDADVDMQRSKYTSNRIYMDRSGDSKKLLDPPTADPHPQGKSQSFAWKPFRNLAVLPLSFCTPCKWPDHHTRIKSFGHVELAFYCTFHIQWHKRFSVSNRLSFF